MLRALRFSNPSENDGARKRRDPVVDLLGLSDALLRLKRGVEIRFDHLSEGARSAVGLPTFGRRILI